MFPRDSPTFCQSLPQQGWGQGKSIKFSLRVHVSLFLWTLAYGIPACNLPITLQCKLKFLCLSAGECFWNDPHVQDVLIKTSFRIKTNVCLDGCLKVILSPGTKFCSSFLFMHILPLEEELNRNSEMNKTKFKRQQAQGGSWPFLVCAFTFFWKSAVSAAFIIGAFIHMLSGELSRWHSIHPF